MFVRGNAFGGYKVWAPLDLLAGKNDLGEEKLNVLPCSVVINVLSLHIKATVVQLKPLLSGQYVM